MNSSLQFRLCQVRQAQVRSRLAMGQLAWFPAKGCKLQQSNVPSKLSLFLILTYALICFAFNASAMPRMPIASTGLLAQSISMPLSSLKVISKSELLAPSSDYPQSTHFHPVPIDRVLRQASQWATTTIIKSRPNSTTDLPNSFFKDKYIILLLLGVTMAVALIWILLAVLPYYLRTRKAKKNQVNEAKCVKIQAKIHDCECKGPGTGLVAELYQHHHKAPFHPKASASCIGRGKTEITTDNSQLQSFVGNNSNSTNSGLSTANGTDSMPSTSATSKQLVSGMSDQTHSSYGALLGEESIKTINSNEEAAVLNNILKHFKLIERFNRIEKKHLKAEPTKETHKDIEAIPPHAQAKQPPHHNNKVNSTCSPTQAKLAHTNNYH